MSKSSKIKDAFTKNIGLKIVALILGSIIWLAVVNTSDPSTTVTVHNIPITITNQKAITKQGLVYDVTSKQKVDVTVSGNRSVVSGLTADDFKATASLKELSMVKAAPVTVKLKDRSNARRVNILSQDVNTVTIDINKVVKEKYPVEVKFIGKPAEGYVAKIKSMSFNNVLVKASEAAHKKIDKVVAKVDIATLVSAAQLENRPNSTTVNCGGSVTSFKPGQKWKALLPMVVTLSGIVTVCNAALPKKARLPMVVTLSGTTKVDLPYWLGTRTSVVISLLNNTPSSSQ